MALEVKTQLDVRDTGSIPGSGRSLGEGNGKLTSIFLHGAFLRQMDLADSSP